MKKSLVALAVLAAAGAASAQSSVTLFGVVDATYQRTAADGNGSVTRLTNSGYNSSRLGFRGTEDLGGGMSASFWLEAGLNNDNGSGANTQTNNQVAQNSVGGFTFNRRSTVSVAGGFGEVRLGRDYVPAFWNHTVFDPFGTVGSGSTANLSLAYGGVLGAQTTIRASNSIGYFLPGGLGGFYGQVMYAMGENNSNTGAASKNGNHTGFRAGFANGPINVAVGYGTTQLAAGLDYVNTNVGGSYDMGVAKLMAQWNKEDAGGIDHTTYMLGALVPMGAGEIRASWTSGKMTANAIKGNQLALGYVHNLSKRTAVYATYARVKNSGLAANYALNGLASPVAGGSLSGLDLGVRHSF